MGVYASQLTQLGRINNVALLYFTAESERFSLSRNLFKLSDDSIKSSRWCVRGGWRLMCKQSCGDQNIIGEWKGNDMGQLL